MISTAIPHSESTARSSQVPAALYRALTLDERARGLHGRAHPPAAHARAAGRLRAWNAPPAFRERLWFERRLAAAGIAEHHLAFLLGEADESLAARHTPPPAWLRDLSTLCTAPAAPLSLPPSVLQRPDHPFLFAVAPLLAQAHATLTAGVARIAAGAGWPALHAATLPETLAEEMTHAVLNHVCRTMVLELHVARIEGRLRGHSGGQRFHSFTDRFRQPRARAALLAEYPVLGRLVIDTIDRYVGTRLEFLQRLSFDREQLCAMLGGPQPGDGIAEICTMGDPHRGGRGVLRVRFASGLQVVYKPKPLAVDVHFQSLLRHLNGHGWDMPFRTLRVADRGEYGWTEFLSPQPCASEDGLARFYTRMGGVLALLHVLGATDFHFENLIAVGDQPVLIDLETLFHPALVGPSPDAGTSRVNREIAESVLGVGLLPERASFGAPDGSIDLSGLGARGDQLSPVATPCWVDAGTDEMRLERRRMVLPEGEHTPALRDAACPIDVTAYSGEIVAGFERMYRLIAQRRHELMAPHGHFSAFAGDTTRVVLRPTHSYYVLCREGAHPDLLRDALDRDRHFDRLWAGVPAHQPLARVVAYEHEDVRAGDVPLFTTRPSSRDLWSSRGERIPDYLDESGMQLVERRLQRMGDADLHRQLWLVRASLASVVPAQPARVSPATPSREDAEHVEAARRRPTTRPLGGASPLDLAVAIGNRLATSALVENGHASWIGEMAARDGGSVIRPLGADLYAGLAGVALFLARLADVTGERAYGTLAREALQSARGQIASRAGTAGIGGFTGWGSVVYALSHLAVVLDDATLLHEAEALADSLAASVASDEQLDVLSGAAGFLLALLSLHSATGSDRALRLARACGDRLVRTAIPAGPGAGWTIPGAGEAPLAGLSHGAAGIALALLNLNALTCEPIYLATALAAFRYERSLFDPASGAWPDLRSGAAAAGGLNAWCHGAPGIGLARLASLPILDDGAVREEIEHAVGATLAEGFEMNHSLCHGALGNLELPVAAARAFGRQDWQAQADEALGRIVGRLAAAGPICGSLAGLETPGLMTGLAGIGYGLLRIAHPERVPSVLVMQPAWPAGGEMRR